MPAKKAAPSGKAAASAKKVAPPKKAAPVKKAAAAVKVAAPVKKAAAAVKVAAPAKPKPVPQVTITLKQIAVELSESRGVPKKQAEEMLGDLVAAATRHLKDGAKIRLTGLGILQVRALPARMGRNPATGEAIEIKASKKVAFRPAKELKEAV